MRLSLGLSLTRRSLMIWCPPSVALNWQLLWVQVRELELQIGLVQQLNSQGLRKDEFSAAAEPSDNVARTGNAPGPALPPGGPARAVAGSGGPLTPEEATTSAADTDDDTLVTQPPGDSTAGEEPARRARPHVNALRDSSASAAVSVPADGASLDGAARAGLAASDASAGVTAMQQPLASEVISAAASAASEQAAAWEAVRRKHAKKALSDRPRMPAAEAVPPSYPAAVTEDSNKGAVSKEWPRDGEAPPPPTPPQPPVKRKPYSYGPRSPSTNASASQATRSITASTPHTAASAMLLTGNGLGSPGSLEQGDAAAAQASGQASTEQLGRSGGTRAPSGVIYVSGELHCSPREAASKGGAKLRRRVFSYGPRLAASPSKTPNDSSTAEDISSSAIGLTEAEISSSDVGRAEAAVVLSRHSAPVREVLRTG